MGSIGREPKARIPFQPSSVTLPTPTGPGRVRSPSSSGGCGGVGSCRRPPLPSRLLPPAALRLAPLLNLPSRQPADLFLSTSAMVPTPSSSLRLLLLPRPPDASICLPAKLGRHGRDLPPRARGKLGPSLVPWIAGEIEPSRSRTASSRTTPRRQPPRRAGRRQVRPRGVLLRAALWLHAHHPATLPSCAV